MTAPEESVAPVEDAPAEEIAEVRDADPSAAPNQEEMLEEVEAPPASRGRAQLNVAIHRALAGEAGAAQAHLAQALRLDPDLVTVARGQPALEGLHPPN